MSALRFHTITLGPTIGIAFDPDEMPGDLINLRKDALRAVVAVAEVGRAVSVGEQSPHDLYAVIGVLANLAIAADAEVAARGAA